MKGTKCLFLKLLYYFGIVHDTKILSSQILCAWNEKENTLLTGAGCPNTHRREAIHFQSFLSYNTFCNEIRPRKWLVSDTQLALLGALSCLTISLLFQIRFSEPLFCPLPRFLGLHRAVTSDQIVKPHFFRLVKRSFIHPFKHLFCKSYSWMKANKSMNELLRLDLWM